MIQVSVCSKSFDHRELDDAAEKNGGSFGNFGTETIQYDFDNKKSAEQFVEDITNGDKKMKKKVYGIRDLDESKRIPRRLPLLENLGKSKVNEEIEDGGDYQLLVTSCYKDVDEDDFENGMQGSPKTVDVSFDGLYESVKDIEEKCGLSEGTWASAGYGILEYSVRENADGSPVTKSEIEDWKKGKTKIWIADYSFHVKLVKPRDPSQDELIDILKGEGLYESLSARKEVYEFISGLKNVGRAIKGAIKKGTENIKKSYQEGEAKALLDKIKKEIDQYVKATGTKRDDVVLALAESLLEGHYTGANRMGAVSPKEVYELLPGLKNMGRAIKGAMKKGVEDVKKSYQEGEAKALLDKIKADVDKYVKATGLKKDDVVLGLAENLLVKKSVSEEFHSSFDGFKKMEEKDLESYPGAEEGMLLNDGASENWTYLYSQDKGLMSIMGMNGDNPAQLDVECDEFLVEKIVNMTADVEDWEGLKGIVEDNWSSETITEGKLELAVSDMASRVSSISPELKKKVEELMKPLGDLNKAEIGSLVKAKTQLLKWEKESRTNKK
jgi:hypothetical protein